MLVTNIDDLRDILSDENIVTNEPDDNFVAKPNFGTELNFGLDSNFRVPPEIEGTRGRKDIY